MSVPQHILILLMRVYRLTISPMQAILLGDSFGCRYTPTCSAYALEALQKHGAVQGSVLTVKRLCRCHPFGGCGHDPVPSRGTDGALPGAGSKRGAAFGPLQCGLHGDRGATGRVSRFGSQCGVNAALPAPGAGTTL